MTIDRYTSQPIVGNIRVYEIFKGHRVLTERDRQMNSRLIDKIVNGVQLELPPDAPGFLYLDYDDFGWCYATVTVMKLLDSTALAFRRPMVCEAVAYWTIIINKLKKITGSEWCDVYQQFHDAVAQRDAWLSLLEESK